MHLRDHGLRQIPDREPSFHDVPRPAAVAAGRRIGPAGAQVGGEVVPRGKARARAADDRHPHGVVGVGRAHILEPTGTASGRAVVWSHPAFAHKSMYARNDKEIVCVSLAKE